MKRTHIGLIILALMAVSSNRLLAQEATHLSLSEAIELGLENSNYVKIAVSKQREAKALTNEMKDHMLPEIDLGGQYMRLNQPNISGNLLSGNDNSGSGSNEEQAAPGFVMLGQASFSLPLFTGFKIKNGIKSAEFLENAAELDTDARRGDAVLNIINAYINLYKAETAVDLVKENLSQSQKRITDFTDMEQNGVLAHNDVLKAQLLESNTSLALLDAENNYKVASFNMELMLGMAETGLLEVDHPNTNKLPESISYQDFSTTALSDRQDLLAQNERVKASNAQLEVAKGNYLPSVGLSAGYVAAEIENVLTVTNALNVGIGVSYNLSNLFKNNTQVQQAKEHQIQSNFMLDQLSDQVRTEVFKAFSDYEESLKRITVFESAQQQAAENYRITKDKHDNSLATTTELLDADVDQFRAELNLKYAQADAFLAYFHLLKVSGQLDEQAKQIF